MSERTPKQPLNDPEYTVPEYSVLLPSDEAENSTVESSATEDNAPGDSAPEQTTTGYTAPVASEQVIPKRPQAMRNVMWCAVAMIALMVLSSSLRILLPSQSYIDFEMVVRTLFSMLAFTLFASIIPIFILWKVWDGREWARILTIIGNAFAVANGQNLMFCEDAARRLNNVFRCASFCEAFDIRVEHQESLHPHNAVARIHWKGSKNVT